jgi:hypothetical protein
MLLRERRRVLQRLLYLTEIILWMDRRSDWRLDGDVIRQAIGLVLLVVRLGI